MRPDWPSSFAGKSIQGKFGGEDEGQNKGHLLMIARLGYENCGVAEGCFDEISKFDKVSGFDEGVR